MKFLLRNILNLLLAMGIGVAIYIAANWSAMPVMQRILGLYFIGFVLHVWEEFRYPGGFPEMVMGRLNFTLPNPHAAEAVLTGFVLYLVFIPFLFPNVIWMAMASMVLGVMQAIGHTAEIWIFRLKHYYSPGLVTAVTMFLPISIVGITYAVRHDLMQPWQWLYSVLYLLSGFALTQGTIVRMSGLTYSEFLKRGRTELFTKQG